MDDILDKARGALDTGIIIGLDKNGEIKMWVSNEANVCFQVWMLEKAKHSILLNSSHTL